MSRKVTRVALTMFGFLTAGLNTGAVIADWSGTTPKGYYNQGYGDFPPSDIEQRLFGHLNEVDKKEASPPPASEPVAVNKPPASVSPATNTVKRNVMRGNNPGQNYAGQGYNRANGQNPPSPAYGRYQQSRNYPSHQASRNNRDFGFNGPWNNSGSGFNGPWNNRGGSFSGPWNNNNQSGFNGPWNNSSGSGFSMPWGNNNRSNNNRGNYNRGSNNSGFNPMGGSWGW